MPNNLFPLEVSVLSQNALRDSIQAAYFPSKTNVSCRLYYRSLHDTYRVIADNTTYFYKIYRQNSRSETQIQAEIDLLRHLYHCDIDAVRPVPQMNGSYIGAFQTANGVRYGVLFAAVNGREFDDIEETAQLNEKLGMYIASVHNALDTYNLPYDRWNLDSSMFIDHSMDTIRLFRNHFDFDIDFLEDMAFKTKEKLSFLSVEKPQFGICHGDIYGGNIRVGDNGNPILFDFDFCGNGWRAYDISLYAYSFGLGFDQSKFGKRERRKESFLNGYTKIMPMNENEIRSIGLFIPFRRIFNIGYLYMTMLSNTWGEAAVIRNTNDDVLNLKKWLDLNPVL